MIKFGGHMKGGLPTIAILRWSILFSLVTILLSPGVGGDSQVYHLPNIANILKSGSLADFQPEHLYRAEAITSYYPRGFEAACALFYAMPFPRTFIILFKCLLFSGLWFVFRKESGSRLVATGLFVLLLSMEFVRGDLGNLKNDLVMAIPLVYAAWAVCSRTPPKQGLWSIPVACALTLSIKASALLYSAPVLLMWLWVYRRQWVKQLIVVLGVLLPFGLLFYWINWVQLGNPIYPFEVKLGECVLFPGRSGGLFHTTILANLDATSLLLFARGLLRSAGPGGVLGLLVAGFWALGTGYWALISCFQDRKSAVGCQRRSSELLSSDLCPPHSVVRTLLLMLWLFTFLITPFSDNNGAVHNLLYSGNTIRLAFPAILFAFLIITYPLAEWIGSSARKEKWFVRGIAVAALINLFWYDAVCLFAKPENALVALAPVARSFDNRVLAGWALGLGVACAAAVCLRRRWLAVGLVAAAICLQQAGYPQGLTYSMRFKQLGQMSEVFNFLDIQDFDSTDTVAIHSADESSFFLACVNEYLLVRTGRMFYAEALGDLEGLTEESPTSKPSNIQHLTSHTPNWLIVCAKDAFELGDRVRGRQYRISWDFLAETKIPAGYREVFSDEFYRIYLSSWGD
jgi:hypothetical protein